MKALRWLLYVVGALVVLGVIGNLIDPNRSRAVFSSETKSDAAVLLTRDSNELRFTNDGPDALGDCDVTIEGNYSAVLRELPVREQKFLVRAQFSPAVPDGEFYARALRSTKMECNESDGLGGSRRVNVRFK